MEPSEQPSKLLALPRELRDEIYFQLLSSKTDPPPNTSFAGERIRWYDVMLPKHYTPWRCPGLIWTNRQLRREFLEYASKPGIRAADIDIMVKGYVQYPTWTRLPVRLPDRMPFNLNVTLRVFSTESFHSNDGWPRQPGVAFRLLLRMLICLVHYGPGLLKDRQIAPAQGLCRIKRLSVNVCFIDDYTPATWPDAAHDIFKMLKALALDGVANGVIESIHGHTEYVHDKKLVIFDREWEVSTRSNDLHIQRWRDMGFLSPQQKRLGEELSIAIALGIHG